MPVSPPFSLPENCSLIRCESPPCGPILASQNQNERRSSRETLGFGRFSLLYSEEAE
jgi:hypothetical protein